MGNPNHSQVDGKFIAKGTMEFVTACEENDRENKRPTLTTYTNEYGHEQYKDENGNTFSKERYTREEAEKASMSLKNCKNCKNCENCENCTDCENCIDCRDCSKCHNCENCRGCHDCWSSFDCIDCTDCSDCENCEDCDGCSFCVNCDWCELCYGQKDLYRCEGEDRDENGDSYMEMAAEDAKYDSWRDDHL